jgi:hypothetical protein
MDLHEWKYWHITRRIQRLRPWLARFYPKWMVRDALIHVIVEVTRPSDIVSDITFVEALRRWMDEVE